MLTLSKTFRFESAHRLAKGYEGKCKNIHGHSWNGQIVIDWVERPLDKYDMALDYKDIGIWSKGIEEVLDHKLLLCVDDTEIIDLCNKQGLSIEVFDDNPTSECLAMHLHDSAEIYFSKWGIEPWEITIVINETCTTSCRYTAPRKTIKI